MKILLCGGGTGGHITPILAIAHELKRQDPDCEVYYVTEKGGKFAHLVKNRTSIDGVYYIRTGKFRRYYGDGLAKRILDVKANALNARDFFYFLAGLNQSLRLLNKLKPDAILLKGSYVGLPIGYAASMKHIKFITHDSDAIPGLGNKLASKWSVYNATGFPNGSYTYPKDKIRYVGVPLTADYQTVNKSLKAQYRHDIDVPNDVKLLFITGGSLGATKLNEVLYKLIPKLINEYKDLNIIHQVGKGNAHTYTETFDKKRLKEAEFIPDIFRYTGAADVVIARGGATSIAELAVQGKAAIIVPNPLLAGGHQLRNAKEVQSLNAAIVINEDDLTNNPSLLFDSCSELLSSAEKRKDLAKNIKSMAIDNSSELIAKLLIKVANT